MHYFSWSSFAGYIAAIVVLGTTDNLSWLICFLRNCKVLFLMIKCTAEPSLAKNSNTWFSQCVFKRNIPLHFTIAANVPCVMSSARGAIYPSLKRTNWPWSWFYKQLGIITDFMNALLIQGVPTSFGWKAFSENLKNCKNKIFIFYFLSNWRGICTD